MHGVHMREIFFLSASNPVSHLHSDIHFAKHPKTILLGQKFYVDQHSLIGKSGKCVTSSI